MTDSRCHLGQLPNGAFGDDLDVYKAMSREELEQYAFAVTGQLGSVINTAKHWRDSNKRLVADGYVSPFQYSLPELAVTIQQAIFWANWPAVEHRDIFAEPEPDDEPAAS